MVSGKIIIFRRFLVSKQSFGKCPFMRMQAVLEVLRAVAVKINIFCDVKSCR